LSQPADIQQLLPVVRRITLLPTTQQYADQLKSRVLNT